MYQIPTPVPPNNPNINGAIIIIATIGFLFIIRRL